MTSEPLFRDDAYLASCSATVTNVNDRGGIVLDRTVFYATSGGQPGDRGLLKSPSGDIAIATTVKGEGPGEIVHVPGEASALPAAGDSIEATIDWARRHRLMRLHTCMHLLCATIPFPVTGGQISDDYARLDFDIADAPLDRDALTGQLNEMIAADHPVTSEWITDEELAAKPDLVRTMKVKPPMGTGRVRLIRIGDVDLQPCGGTHVRSTAEIGRVAVTKIESKGAHNRRVRVAFAED